MWRQEHSQPPLQVRQEAQALRVRRRGEQPFRAPASCSTSRAPSITAHAAAAPQGDRSASAPEPRSPAAESLPAPQPAAARTCASSLAIPPARSCARTSSPATHSQPAANSQDDPSGDFLDAQDRQPYSHSARSPQDSFARAVSGTSGHVDSHGKFFGSFGTPMAAPTLPMPPPAPVIPAPRMPPPAAAQDPDSDDKDKALRQLVSSLTTIARRV